MPKRVYANLKHFLKENPDVLADAIAEEVGCSPSHFSQIKWGLRQPTLPLALKIASRCNVPLESLVINQDALKHAS